MTTTSQYDREHEARIFYQLAGHNLAGLAVEFEDPNLGGFFDFLKPKGDKTYRQKPTLAKGAKGADVVEVQRLLGIQQSGNFDFTTETAVKAYQTQYGIQANGVVAGQTWAALLGEVYVDPAQAAATTAAGVQGVVDVVGGLFGQFFKPPTATQEQLMTPPTQEVSRGPSIYMLIGGGAVALVLSGAALYGVYRLANRS